MQWVLGAVFVLGTTRAVYVVLFGPTAERGASVGRLMAVVLIVVVAFLWRLRAAPDDGESTSL